MNHPKKIDLPLEKNKYILTQEAVAIIKQASYLHASFKFQNNERVERNCWLHVGVKKTIVKQKVEVVFQMPINVCGISTSINWEFSSRVEYIGQCGELHPIQGLIKKGAILDFEPYNDAHTTNHLKKLNLVGDVLYWNVKVGGKQYRNIFEARVTEVHSRLIQQSPCTIYRLQAAS